VPTHKRKDRGRAHRFRVAKALSPCSGVGGPPWRFMFWLAKPRKAATVARKFCLLAAWAALSAIVVLTMVPPNLRPTTDAPHDVEHGAAFLITGLLFGLAYPGRERILTIGSVVFCAVIEILQLYVPGRHARWIDFVVDAIAAISGIFVGALAIRALQQRRP
jgi:VanZ like family